MRLGWYARLVIVLMVFYTIGMGVNRSNQDAKAGYAAQENSRQMCESFEAKGIPLRDRRSGEECSDYASRQFSWMFGWDTFSNNLMIKGVEALVLGLLSIILYWTGRWVLAGRRTSPRTPDPT